MWTIIYQANGGFDTKEEKQLSDQLERNGLLMHEIVGDGWASYILMFYKYCFKSLFYWLLNIVLIDMKLNLFQFNYYFNC